MNPKPLISAVPICAVLQVSVQVEDVLFEINFKLCNIWFVALVRLEHLPCAKERGRRNYQPM
jgi:hypothetical protein